MKPETWFFIFVGVLLAICFIGVPLMLIYITDPETLTRWREKAKYEALRKTREDTDARELPLVWNPSQGSWNQLGEEQGTSRVGVSDQRTDYRPHQSEENGEPE